MNKTTFKTISKKRISDTITPVGLYLRFRDKYANTLLLESSDYHSKEESFSFIAIEPLVTMKVEDHNFTVSKQGKIIHCYGASTKGNVLLQYFNISNKMITFAAERNKTKYNLYTPGSRIKIISEVLSRFYKPDYYLVLPWHFKNEILIREKEIRKKGTKFIFPLPNFKII